MLPAITFLWSPAKKPTLTFWLREKSMRMTDPTVHEPVCLVWRCAVVCRLVVARVTSLQPQPGLCVTTGPGAAGVLSPLGHGHADGAAAGQ